MKTWYIWGLYLPVLLIEANTFDEALEEARRINPNYNIGKLREGRRYDKTTIYRESNRERCRQ